MTKIQIIHNPTAGDSDLNKEVLLDKIARGNRTVEYVSTEDENWSHFHLRDEEIIVLAGGDGTIHKLATVLLQKSAGKIPVPVYLVPAGTANNIAATLGISSSRDFELEGADEKIQPFDHGKISAFPEHNFFLEGVGFGLFPELIRKMKSIEDVPSETSEEKLQRTLKVLRGLAENLEPQTVELVADEQRITGKFLMAEVQNTKYIGPKLELAPVSKPGDGYFDLVLIGEEEREQLLNYIDGLIQGTPAKEGAKNFVQSRKVKKVSLKSSWDYLHIDDDPVENRKDKTITAEVVQGTFRFF